MILRKRQQQAAGHSGDTAVVWDRPIWRQLVHDARKQLSDRGL